MKNIEKFSASLYTRKSLKTEKECLKYLAEINIPVLSVCNREICDAPITLTDIFNALNSMQANKSPGNDGLTKEFHVAFFDLLGPKLLNSFKFAFNLEELSSSQKQAVITLIEKKGRDKRYLKNWRPISLLNVDTKLLSKVLACRIKKVIATLVSSDQTAYSTGRSQQNTDFAKTNQNEVLRIRKNFFEDFRIRKLIRENEFVILNL